MGKVKLVQDKWDQEGAGKARVPGLGLIDSLK